MTYCHVVPRLNDGDRWVVSDAVNVSWSSGRIAVASLLSTERFATDDVDVLRVLHAFARPITIDEVVTTLGDCPPREIRALIEQLVEAGLLDSAAPGCTPRTRGWPLKTLAMHRATRQAATRGTADAIGVRERSDRPFVSLGALAPPVARDFADVLEWRRSVRTWARRPIERETFSSLLSLSARNRISPGSAHSSGTEVHRAYPSGGGLYSLSLYPILGPSAVESLAAGVYRYVPEVHGLELIADQSRAYQPFLDAAARSADAAYAPIALVMTSRFGEQRQVYGDLAYSLVLKEVGALFQTLYLVAAYLNLGACALGGGTPDALLAHLCGVHELDEPVVGELIVGSIFSESNSSPEPRPASQDPFPSRQAPA